MQHLERFLDLFKTWKFDKHHDDISMPTRHGWSFCFSFPGLGL